MARPKNRVETKHQILEAATQLFSRKGFRATTIAEICQLAGTNIASVNYHFGDKDSLYIEAWRTAFRYAHEKYPVDGGVPTDASPEERLRGWIVSMLKRITDPECNDIEIIHMEMTNPTGLLFGPMKEALVPIRKILCGILRDILGENASDEDIQLCQMSVISQCMNPPIIERRFLPRSTDEITFKPPPLDMKLEQIAEHVIRFSLEGLKAIRQQIERRPPPSRKHSG
ncbi:MAG TPA: CerR family C-terminal domain-containing protein [Candidatus Sumerlaeota bacterium]|nr:CerR family C-terminal domain-containing protein [Candidatus Sumerlaeota bacterium]HPS00034.1 CerR family C-terminal domain-containing protein [Candidatus Sumerlaeota bacterium]